MQLSIRNYLIDRSAIASNRTVIDKTNPLENEFKPLMSIRYLEDNQVELFKQFPEANQLCKKTFVHYLKKDGRFKKPHRLTDMCEYCEELRKLRQCLSNNLQQLRYQMELIQNEFDLADVKKFLKKKREDITLQNSESTLVCFFILNV